MRTLFMVILLMVPVSGWSQALHLGYQGQVDDQLIGINAGYYLKQNMGFGVGWRTGTDNQRDNDYFYDNITVDEAEGWDDPLQKTEYAWDSYMLYFYAGHYGFMYGYAGGGVSEYYEYRQYKDPSNILAPNGLYWVEAGEKKREFNFEIGLQAITNFVAVQVGYQTKPEGVTVGAGIMLDLTRWMQ